MSAQPSDRGRAQLRGEHWTCLGLGSNIAPDRHLTQALARLRRAVAVQAVSNAWESPAVDRDGPDYVNAALVAQTAMSREELGAKLKQIEDHLDRDRTGGRPARTTIDIDIVVFDGEVLEADLWSEAYRAVPVAELLPHLPVRATGETLAQVADRLAASVAIRRRPEIFGRAPRTGMLRIAAAHSIRTPTP